MMKQKYKRKNRLAVTSVTQTIESKKKCLMVQTLYFFLGLFF